MRALFAFLLSCGATLYCAELEHTPPALNPDSGTVLKAYIETHKQSPIDYVISKFANHDVVILSEFHRIRENELLIQELLPHVYRSGVLVLATEFAERKDQALLDSLLAGKVYDEALAREIMFRQLPFWGFQEYVDIFKAAWQLNRSLPDSAPRFRVLAMGDSPNWSIMKTEEDRENDSLKRLVWRGCGEHLWAKVVTDAVEEGNKALVHCGVHHGFSGYKQPIVDAGEFVRFDTTRAGNYIKSVLGDRVMTVYLHAIWSPRAGYGGSYVYAAEGQIDALFAELGPAYYPVGFDLMNTPFGMLGGANSVYSQGYPDFKIAQFADGWIFQCPLSQYHGVTPIENFINAENLERACSKSPSPSLRKLSVDELNDIIADDAKQAWWLGRFQ